MQPLLTSHSGLGTIMHTSKNSSKTFRGVEMEMRKLFSFHPSPWVLQRGTKGLIHTSLCKPSSFMHTSVCSAVYRASFGPTANVSMCLHLE